MTLFGAVFVALAIALRMMSRLVVRRIGTATLVGASLFLAYTAYFSFFGGFCFDPGDMCLTDTRVETFGLLAPLAVIAFGFGVEVALLRHRQRGARNS